MTRKDQIKILNDKIEANKRQYDLDRTNAEISAYSSGDLSKYEYLTNKIWAINQMHLNMQNLSICH